MRSSKKIGLLQTIKWLSKGIKINENLLVLVLWREQIRSRKKRFSKPRFNNRVTFRSWKDFYTSSTQLMRGNFCKGQNFPSFHFPFFTLQLFIFPFPSELHSSKYNSYFSLLSNLCQTNKQTEKCRQHLYFYLFCAPFDRLEVIGWCLTFHFSNGYSFWELHICWRPFWHSVRLNFLVQFARINCSRVCVFFEWVIDEAKILAKTKTNVGFPRIPTMPAKFFARLEFGMHPTDRVGECVQLSVHKNGIILSFCLVSA